MSEEYNKCTKCDTVTEFLESANSRKKHICGKCGSSKTEKQFSTFAVGIAQPGQDSKCHGCSDGGCPHSMN